MLQLTILNAVRANTASANELATELVSLSIQIQNPVQVEIRANLRIDNIEEDLQET
jgi:hypothetical protein